MAITITLPDQSTRNFDAAVTGEEVAASIGKGLAKAALAIRVNGKLQDLYLPITSDARVEIVTPASPEGLEIIRHDAAHLMAEAVKELFPDTQVTIGPAIENGFYYDFAREKPFSTEDLGVIEKRMQEISQRAEPVRREEWNRDKAVEYFNSIGEHYKAEIIASIPSDQIISLYKQGVFMDLCRGPHAPSTAHVRAFKLMKVAGAYWRGDSNNAMLQRIYGTAWADEKQLKAYLTMLEEAEKRDHRKLARELDLFHIQEEAVGQVFWHDKGWTLYRVVENFIRHKLQPKGYKEVKTPLLLDRSLWEASGHWDKFGAKNMFTAESEDHVLALKPMNCPGHIQIFKQGTKSYRDLPLRMAEFGSCHRNEPSGALHGIMRVRGFTQDDAHIFCTPEQITSETIAFCDLLKDVYKAFGFNDIKVKFSDRPPTRAGEDKVWDIAENALKEAVTEAKLDWTLNPGEGAFYGPKLEFVLRDAIGRDWQCGTLQVDFVLPERLDAEYVGPDGAKHRPVMLHRAILGSLERFIGILIEEYAGKFPLWLAPVQVMVTTITNEADDYALEVKAALEAQGLRTGIDISSSKINYKIREHSNAKIPAIFALGGREKAEKTVSIRRIGSERQEVMPLADAVKALALEARAPL
jgi:threonyl-tRNA synthetase